MESINNMATATYKLYKLHFTSPLHIADRHEDDSNSLKTIQSDTLYAALMSCLAKTGSTIPDNGDLGFTAHALSILGYCSRHLLPKALRQRLTDWALKIGEGKSVDCGLALTMYLSKLYKPVDIPDRIGAEINQEFEENQQQASAKEAFERM